jgi:hypothetical protein
MQLHMFTKPISVLFWPLHTIFYSSTKYESIKYPTQPRPVAVQPKPRPSYRVEMFFLIHTPKGWMQVHMFINPIPTKTQTKLQSLNVLPQPYS